MEYQKIREIFWKNPQNTDLGGFVELGAQWIHGRGDNPVWQYVLNNNLPGTRGGYF